jgi:phenylpropionate dioxygenase-like ring-hydroxylating dioxygenase large terminal subunit
MNIEVKPAEFWKIETGTQVDKVPTALEIVAIDKEPLPFVLQHAGDIEPAPRIIPYDRYYDPKYVDLEVEHIWKKQWQIACRVEDIPNVGDRVNYDIVDLSFLIVRSGPNEFKAFYNTCRHRGRKLCEAKGSGTGIRCAFHGWSYGLDGKLEWVPYQQDFPHVDSKHYSLVPVKCATWGGNVFINPDPKAPPLEEALAPLVDHYKAHPQEARYTANRIFIEVGCNWKAAQEAFMEGYHVLESHADAMPFVNSASTQIDCWSDGLGYVSRLFTPAVITDTWVENRVNTKEMLFLYCDAYGIPQPPADRGHTVADARRYVADVRRKRVEEQSGKDLSKESITYLIDQAKYFMFPNFHPFWGEGSPRWFNFKPMGRDTNSSVMEFRTLLPIPPSGEVPPLPEPFHLKLGERMSDKAPPHMGRSAHLIDQDLDNMCANQRGFKAAAKSAAFLTLSKYHEAKIRRFHEIYDKVLGLEGND